jgi:hypothetical protein
MSEPSPVQPDCEHHYASRLGGFSPHIRHVRICMLCGSVDFDDLAEQSIEIRTEAYREAAERVLLVSEVAHGLRCPRCHGKPAVQPHFLEKNPRYRCGGGHVWTRPAVVEGASARPETILYAIAETGQLPPIPERIEPGDCPAVYQADGQEG